MDLPIRPGSVTVVYGNDVGGRTRKLRRVLRQLVGSGFARGENLLIACHPFEREQVDFDLSGVVENYGILETNSVDEILRDINLWETSHVVVLGASHFSGRTEYGTDAHGRPLLRPDIALLAQAAEMSGRTFIANGPSLDESGQPYGCMPELIALASKVFAVPDTTSSLDQFFGHHIPRKDKGGIYIRTGPMFAGKTDPICALVESDRAKLESLEGAHVYRLFNGNGNGDDCLAILYKWVHDVRYESDAENATTHGGDSFKANPVINAYEIREHLSSLGKNAPKSVGIIEAQMMDGLEPVVRELAGEGYAFLLDGLLRSFNLMPFGSLPRIACYADTVDFSTGACSSCRYASTESQRYVRKEKGKIVPVPFNDVQLSVGGGEKAGEVALDGERKYRSTCLAHLVIPSMPRNRFRLPDYVK